MTERVTSGEIGRVRVVSPNEARLEPWAGTQEDVLEGELRMRAEVLWASADGRTANGVWQADPCTVRLIHPFDETFVVLEGCLTIESDGLAPRVMNPGDAVVIAEGTTSVWTIHERVTKLFAIHRDEGLPA